MHKLYERPNSPYWYAEIPTPTGIKRISTGVPRGAKTRGKAQQVAEDKRASLVSASQQVESPLLSQVWLHYSLTKTGIKESTRDLYGLKMAALIHHLKNPPLADVTPALIRQYIRDRRGLTSDIQLRLELGALSSVFEHIIAEDAPYAPETNPVKLVKKDMLGTYNKKPRWLKPDQLRRLRAALERRPFFRDFVSLLLETGMRKEELLGLEWSEVDVDNMTITLKPGREKTKKGRTIPLTRMALNTLLAQQRHTGVPYVFVNPHTRTRRKYVYTTWSKIREEAGLPTTRIHDLRHTLATHLRHSGVAREDRMDLLGHSSEDAHGGYADKSIDILREVLEKHSPNTLSTHSPKV